MATTLILPGVKIPAEKRVEKLFGGLVQAATVHAARVELTARGSVAAEHPLEGIDGHHVIELEWEGGVREWTSVERLRQELGRQAPERAAGRSDLRVPAVHRRGSQSRGGRGGLGWVLQGLKILRIDLAPELEGLDARDLAGRLESHLVPGPGLYRCPPDLRPQAEDQVASGLIPDDGPALVLIHGAVSRTPESFGGLAGKSEWEDLRSHYGDRVFALEHLTLSVSPLDNAIDLVERLPSGAELDLVTHSRGGLVGELICRGEISESDLEPFERAGLKEDVERFRRLSDLLKEKRPRVGRFVRIACPARGALLASSRLDRHLSVLVNLFGFLPSLAASPIHDFAKAALLALARQRARLDELPGLAALRPSSPVIHLINRPGVTREADLAVIVGDVQGEGLWGRLTSLASDLFYREDHDLAVNTESMYGGIGGRGAGKVGFFFDKGPSVHHFGYCDSVGTRTRISAWLRRQDDDAARSFKELPLEPPQEITRDPGEAAAVTQGRRDQPATFLIPDFLGSRLRDRHGARVWLDLESLALGGLARLAVENRVQEDGLVPEPYASLVRFLRFRNRVIPFPYDWRRSVLDAGASLANAVRVELESHDRPVRLLAHGLGGLVARALIADHPDVWKRLCDRGGRLVMLGTPNAGTYFAVRLLLGQEKLTRLLDLADIGHRPAERIGLFARFPALLEMLPRDREAKLKLSETSSWQELLRAAGFSRREDLEDAMPDAGDLRRAREVRERLARAAGPEGMVSVAGSAPWTPCRIAEERSPGEPLFEGTPEGDGRVPHSLGRLEGVPTWYLDVPHGALANHRPAFPALAELLDRGHTEQLSSTPPERVRLDGPVLPSPSEARLLFPEETDLVAAALGYPPVPPAITDLLSLRISVAHGDLAYARFPVAVGHYAKDTIVSAESLLDRRLGGILTERYRLGLYPGPAGSVEVVHSPDASPPGALVIGLGELGEVSSQAVTAGVMVAALRHALQIAERPSAVGEGERWRSAAFSSVLLGTGGGRSITVEESVAAVVRGAVQANRSLRNQGFWNRVRIDEIELVELYEGVAIRAARAARSIGDHLRISLEEHERIETALHLRSLPGGQIRQPVSQYDTGWWRRLYISSPGGSHEAGTAGGERSSEPESGELSFEVLTERARTEQRQQVLQRSLVDRFVEEAAGSSAYSREVTSTLFELLLPNALKDQAHEQTDLVLLLDDSTAQYPWELLTERMLGRSEPFATTAGLIRQLRTQEGEFRPSVRTPRDRYALVVGDPPSDMPELPGAQAEARAVHDVLLAAGYDVTAVIGKPGWEVISELFAREYQILHLAGHGLYDPENPRESGMVLGEKLFLTSGELRQLRAVPPFVFINCCHLGRVDQRTQFSKLAASISTELIRMGVRAVVAAGWAVDDQLATAFARELYQALLSGQTFGRAVLRARNAAYREGPENNTWGAYQCYGDPDFVLDLRSSQRRPEKPDPRGFVSQREFLEELTSLRAEAGSAEKAGWDSLRRRLDSLAAAVPREWRSGELLAALAGARSDLGFWREAITVYREAVDSWGAEIPVQAVQTLANLEIRYADLLRREEKNLPAGSPPAEDPKQLIETATKRLHWLLELGETPERLALVGSAYKRIAAASTSAERRNALRKAADSYGKAHQRTLGEKKALDPYLALNWVTCRHLLGEGEPQELLELISDCERAGGRLAATDSRFPRRLHAADAALCSHLILDDLAEQELDLLCRYQRALASGLGPGETASMVEHLEFLIAMHERRSPQVSRVLRRVVDALGIRALGLKRA